MIDMCNIKILLVVCVALVVWPETIESEESCSDVTIDLPPRAWDQTIKQAAHWKARRNVADIATTLSTQFLAEVVTKFKECDDTDQQCLVLQESTNSRLYKLCSKAAVCHTGDESADENYLPTPGSRKNDRTTSKSSPVDCPSVGKQKSCNGLAIGMLVLGMVLGSMAMAIVCVFIPTLHRKTTRALNKSAARNRHSQWSTSSNYQKHPATVQSASAPPTPQINPSIEQPTYQEVDLDNAQSEYQTIDRNDELDGPVYSELDQQQQQQQHIYNELGDNKRQVHDTDRGTTADSTNEDVVSEDRMNGNTSQNDSTLEGANYFILEPAQSTSASRAETTDHNDEQQHYFKLEPQTNQHPDVTEHPV